MEAAKAVVVRHVTATWEQLAMPDGETAAKKTLHDRIHSNSHQLATDYTPLGQGSAWRSLPLDQEEVNQWGDVVEQLARFKTEDS